MKKILFLKCLFLLPFISSTKETFEDKKSSENCYIQFQERTIFYNSKHPILPVPDIIKESSCPVNTQTLLLKLIKNFEGHVTNKYFLDIFEREIISINKIKIMPLKIKVYELNKQIRMALSLPKEKAISDIDLIRSNNFFSIRLTDSIDIQCSNCDSNGIKNVKINIKDKFGSIINEIWAKIKIKSKINVIKIKADLPAFSNLKPELYFLEEDFETDVPDHYILPITSLKFFKTNKPLKQNEPIKVSDLTPIQLVKAGSKAKIILNHSNLNVTTSALAQNSGGWGDKIQLYNLHTKKMLIGKVIDFDTVIIDI